MLRAASYSLREILATGRSIGSGPVKYLKRCSEVKKNKNHWSAIYVADKCHGAVHDTIPEDG